MVIVDYFSNYAEIQKLANITSYEVIEKMKKIFSIYGIPDELISDSGT